MDRYREFVYPATDQYEAHVQKTQALIAENLMPAERPLSTHITIGNVSTELAFALLTELEKDYVTPQRLKEKMHLHDQFSTRRGK